MTDISMITNVFAGSGKGITKFILNGGLMILGGLAVFGIMRLIKMLKAFNIKVEITDETGSKSIVHGDKARELITKEGRQRWELFRTKGKAGRITIGVPKNDFIDITKTGKKYLRLKKVGPDQYVPWHPTISSEEEQVVKKKIMTSDERTAFISEYEQAERLYPKKGLMKLLEKFMPVITVMICVIAVIMVINVISDTQQEIGNQLDAIRADSLEYAESNIDLQNRMLDFLEGKQIIGQPGGADRPE